MEVEVTPQNQMLKWVCITEFYVIINIRSQLIFTFHIELVDSTWILRIWLKKKPNNLPFPFFH